MEKGGGRLKEVDFCSRKRFKGGSSKKRGDKCFSLVQKNILTRGIAIYIGGRRRGRGGGGGSIEREGFSKKNQKTRMLYSEREKEALVNAKEKNVEGKSLFRGRRGVRKTSATAEKKWPEGKRKIQIWGRE